MANGVVLGNGVGIGAYVVIEEGVEIGEKTQIRAGVYVGRQRKCTVSSLLCARYIKKVLRCRAGRATFF